MTIEPKPGDRDAQPRVAILGAGPIGLEAALACAERGWEFTVYEAGGTVGANVRDWGHVRLFTPWEMNVSARARRALAGEEARSGGEPPGRRALAGEEPPTDGWLPARRALAGEEAP